MPAGQPFTKLCQTLARPPGHGRADLHIHTTFSDGTYTPAQIVELARRSGLAAIAITDHDTLAGIAPARHAAASRLEVIPGVEITAEHDGRELHLLGLFVDPENEALAGALARLQARRLERFDEMLERLRNLGVQVDATDAQRAKSDTTPGRRHLAELLVQAGKAANIREAFQRWLGDRGRVSAPKARLPVGEAIALVRQAGGVAAWAHPSYDACKAALPILCDRGLQALEVEFPSARPGQRRAFRALADRWSLAVTGGSDCHGPGSPARALGACGVSADELELLRAIAGSAICVG